MLNQVGLDVIEAEDGVQALASYKSQRAGPGACSTSTCRPWTALPCAAKSARSRKWAAPCPSSWSRAATNWKPSRQAYEVGATDFISKPINWPILGHRVLYVLRASDAIARLRIADAHNRAVLAAIPDTFFRLNKRRLSISTTNRATTPAPAVFDARALRGQPVCATCCRPKSPRA